MSKQRKKKRTLDDYMGRETVASEPRKKKRKLQKRDKSKKDSHLFTDDNPTTTVHGTGFNSKEKAEQTIAMMEGRDIVYQFQVINTMYYRAKSVLKRTKNIAKRDCIQAAINTFEPWLNDYKSQNRKDEMFQHLDLKMIQKFEGLADEYKISREYLNLYTQINGDPKALRNAAVPKDLLDANECNKAMTWDIYRNKKLRALKHEFADKDDASLYSKDGHPTIIHCKMIMFGYTPDTKKNLIKASKNL